MSERLNAKRVVHHDHRFNIYSLDISAPKSVYIKINGKIIGKISLSISSVQSHGNGEHFKSQILTILASLRQNVWKHLKILR